MGPITKEFGALQSSKQAVGLLAMLRVLQTSVTLKEAPAFRRLSIGKS